MCWCAVEVVKQKKEVGISCHFFIEIHWFKFVCEGINLYVKFKCTVLLLWLQQGHHFLGTFVWGFLINCHWVTCVNYLTKASSCGIITEWSLDCGRKNSMTGLYPNVDMQYNSRKSSWDCFYKAFIDGSRVYLDQTNSIINWTIGDWNCSKWDRFCYLNWWRELWTKSTCIYLLVSGTHWEKLQETR